MEINQLRIGNILSFPFINDLVKVIGINAYEDVNGEIKHTLSIVDSNTRLCHFPITMMNPIPLTEDWLLRFGFYKKKCIGFEWKEEFVKAFDKYGWEIGVLLNTELPQTNPNIGCVSILQSEDEPVSAVPPDLYNKEVWTEDDCRRAENYTEILKAWRQPIAYNVYTVHHLQNIIYNLTGQELTLKQESYE